MILSSFTRHWSFAFTCVVWSCTGVCEAQSPIEEGSRLPNIVLLIADDLGYGELGCQGNPEIPTPCIDALATAGVRCTQAYVTAPNCSPSRAGLFTGRIPTRFGYEFNPIGARNEDAGTGIPPRERTLSEHVHSAGYVTGLMGKWHLGGAADYHPQRHGFDEFYGFLHEGHYYVPPPWTNVTTMLRRRGLPNPKQSRFQVVPSLVYSSHMGHDEPAYDANNPILRSGQPVEEKEYLTDAIAREACDFIDRYQHQPFFLCVAFNAVHSPLQAKNETLDQFANIDDIHRRIFAAMLSDLDSGVGKIVSRIDENKLAPHTLILFLSDNGGPTKELTSSNAPLRDGKGSMYEGGLRVPFLARWTGTIPAGTICEQVISSLDIYPTLATLTGQPVPTKLDGQNLLPALSDEKFRGARTLYWRQGKRAALRSGDWKIVAPGGDPRNRSWELYNLPQDISEANNLANQYPQKVLELKQLWESYDSEMLEPLF